METNDNNKPKEDITPPPFRPKEDHEVEEASIISIQDANQEDAEATDAEEMTDCSDVADAESNAYDVEANGNLTDETLEKPEPSTEEEAEAFAAKIEDDDATAGEAETKEVTEAEVVEEDQPSLTRTLLLEAGIDATEAQCADFKAWLTKEAWKQYKDYLMAKRDLAKNAVDQIRISIPNATKGEKYETVLTIPSMEEAEDFAVEGFENTGLEVKRDSVNPNMFYIEGIPTLANTYDICITYSYPGRHEDEPRLQRMAQFVVNSNPRDLWLDIKTPEDIKYYKSDTAHEYVRVPADAEGNPRKDMVAASQRGRSHAHTGKPRDDDFRLLFDSDSEWYVMAVADGAGSAEYSREGSRIACETVIDICRQKLNKEKNADLEQAIADYDQACKDGNEEGRQDSGKKLKVLLYHLLGNAALTAHNKINEEAAKQGKEAKTYATTLLLSICKKFPFGWFIGAFWVGDGAMCIYNMEKDTAKLLGTPDEGEFSGQTRFLTMREVVQPESVLNRIQFSIEDDFTALMLMTDGVSDPMFGTDANLNNSAKWAELWSHFLNGFPQDNIPPVELVDDFDCSEQLLKWLSFWSQGEHDDRTIAILY